MYLGATIQKKMSVRFLQNIESIIEEFSEAVD